MISSAYLGVCFDPKKLTRIVNDCAETLLSLAGGGLEFDCLAFTGVSGALVTPPLANALSLPMVCVRKPEHSTHSYKRVEGFVGFKRYMIVDDFVSSGGTVRRIGEALGAQRCAGALMYQKPRTGPGRPSAVSYWGGDSAALLEVYGGISVETFDWLCKEGDL